MEPEYETNEYLKERHVLSSIAHLIFFNFMLYVVVAWNWGAE